MVISVRLMNVPCYVTIFFLLHTAQCCISIICQCLLVPRKTECSGMQAVAVMCSFVMPHRKGINRCILLALFPEGDASTPIWWSAPLWFMGHKWPRIKFGTVFECDFCSKFNAFNALPIKLVELTENSKFIQEIDSIRLRERMKKTSRTYHVQLNVQKNAMSIVHAEVCFFLPSIYNRTWNLIRWIQVK